MVPILNHQEGLVLAPGVRVEADRGVEVHHVIGWGVQREEGNDNVAEAMDNVLAEVAASERRRNHQFVRRDIKGIRHESLVLHFIRILLEVDYF